jgi:hypothetical protein
MSDRTNIHDNRATIRWKLLTSVSAAALLVSTYTAGEVLAADADKDRPQIWIGIGGNYDQLDDGSQKFNPLFASNVPSGLPSPVTAEKSPATGFDGEGDFSFQPEDSDWVFKAAIRYGHTGDNNQFLKSVTSTAPKQFVEARASASEKHAILDFTVGKDVGVGLFGSGGVWTISGGVRIAQFNTRAMADLNHTLVYAKYDNVYDGTTQEKRNFHGVGPEITLDGSQPIAGNSNDGQLAVDWGLNGAVLFGRQRAKLRQTNYYIHRHYVKYRYPTTASRVRNVTVSNFGGYAGLSMNYRNAKVSLGYRADEFFGAMDGGQATAKKENRGFYGPYASISIGIGD